MWQVLCAHLREKGKKGGPQWVDGVRMRAATTTRLLGGRTHFCSSLANNDASCCGSGHRFDVLCMVRTILSLLILFERNLTGSSSIVYSVLPFVGEEPGVYCLFDCSECTMSGTSSHLVQYYSRRILKFRAWKTATAKVWRGIYSYYALKHVREQVCLLNLLRCAVWNFISAYTMSKLKRSAQLH